MSIFDLSIKRPVFISTILIALVVFGLVSYSKIGLDMFPGMDTPLATVLTIYPGAGPETVEQDVSKKVEDAVSELSGIDTIRSISVENVSQVVVQFDMEEDGDRAVQAVRDKVSRIAGSLPSDAETPVVEKMDLGAEPILMITVASGEGLGTITETARKKVKEPLQAVSGVGSVDIIGGAEREIKVWVDPLKLEAAGLAVTDVISALRSNNLEFPGGRFKSGGTELSVRIDGDISSPAQIAELPILDMGGRMVRVRDVAQVESGLEEQRSSAVSDGKETVTLLVRKQSGTNSVAAARAVKARLADLKKGLPSGYEVRVVSDQTVVTEASFNAVWFDMIFGGVLAVLIVFVFLRNLRSTLIAAVALPVSVIGTFTFIWAMGFTFNLLTLLALTLSIGLLIDDAIVVIENIYRHMEMGKTAKQAALDGAKEIALAVLATTLSLVAVFLPAALSTGVLGIMMREFGLTVVFAVLISLLVSFTLTPMFSARLLGAQKSNFLYRGIERVLGGIDRGYRGIIGFALSHRIIILLVTAGVVAGTVYTLRYIHMEFTPSPDMGSYTVYVKMPTGTAMEETMKTASRIAKEVEAEIPEITGTVIKVGADVQQTQNKAEIFCNLTDKMSRAATHIQIVERTRKLLVDEKEAEVTVKPTGVISNDLLAAFQLNLRGDDLRVLEESGNRLLDELSRIPGFADLTLSVEGGKPEIQLTVDHERAAGLGVPTVSIGQTVSALVGGADASKVRSNGEDTNVRVRLDERFRSGKTGFGGLKVRSPVTNSLVDVENLVRFEPRSGPAQIDREERERQVSVLANLDSSLSLSAAQHLAEEAAARIVPEGISIAWGGQVKMMSESTSDFKVTLLLAVILIYMVLAAQFESWSHPLTIMMSLPLSVIGAFIAVILSGGVMSIISLIGMLMLMGLVTKNAILLVDYTNTLRRRDGLSRTEALLAAGPTRLRPILMTTLAMIFGMIPVATSHDWGAEIRAPMAVAVIGGLIASTLLTLVVVPVIYTLVDTVGEAVKRLYTRPENENLKEAKV